MADNPQFASGIALGVVQISTANTNRDGTGTLGTLYTAPSGGARIDEIAIAATVTTTAGMVRIFLNDGSSTRLIDEVVVSAVTVGASTESFKYRLRNGNLPLFLLKSGWIIYVSTEKAETFNVFAFGGEF